MAAIKVTVVGAAGRMGREVCKAVAGARDMDLVAAVDVQCAGEPVSALTGLQGCDLTISRSLPQAVERSKCHVAVDFTQPYSRLTNFKAIVAGGARPVIGTTGWTQADIEEARRTCEQAGLGAVIAPNFAIGAVLMMRFAAVAARHMPSVEIIELHHDQKLDAPSGTANQTAQLVALERRAAGILASTPDGAGDSPARGLEYEGIRIHSVRLPGLLAHQEVLFGGLGQTLSVRHDSLSRECFMPGVLLACRKVMDLDGLVWGLDALLD